jgi:hypothetical protein
VFTHEGSCSPDFGEEVIDAATYNFMDFQGSASDKTPRKLSFQVNHDFREMSSILKQVSQSY